MFLAKYSGIGINYGLSLAFALIATCAMGQYSKTSIGIRYGYQYNFHQAIGSSHPFLGYDYNEIFLKPSSALAVNVEYHFNRKNALRFGVGVSIHEFDITNAVDPFFSFVLPYYQTRYYNGNLFLEYKRYFSRKHKIRPFAYVGMNGVTPIKVTAKRVIAFEPSDNYENVDFEAFSELMLEGRIGFGYLHYLSKKFSYELNAILSYELASSYSEFDTTQPFSVGIQLVVNYHFRKKR